MIDTLINGKWTIKLPEHRAKRPEWFTDQGWERARLDSMHEHLSEKDTILYVGAEEGDMAGLCAMWGAQVALFEPNDRVWPNIKAIWDANKLPAPVFTFPGFASTVTTERYVGDLVHKFPRCADGPVIGDHGFKELSDPGEIPQMKIDSYPFDFTAMSIDVEGSEWEVLKGGENAIKEYMPKIWLSVHPEFMFRLYGQYQFELRKWIKDLGYKEKILDYQHELHLFYEA